MKAIEAWDDKLNEWGLVALEMEGSIMPIVGTRSVDAFIHSVGEGRAHEIAEILRTFAYLYHKKIRLVDYITPVVLCETGDPGQ